MCIGDTPKDERWAARMPGAINDVSDMALVFMSFPL
jgi:hypothetical protein